MSMKSTCAISMRNLVFCPSSISGSLGGYRRCLYMIPSTQLRNRGRSRGFLVSRESATNGSSRRPMRLFESVSVTVFEGKVPALLIARSLPLEVFLSHHVQVVVRRQFCSWGRLLSHLFTDCISRPLLCRSTVSY